MRGIANFLSFFSISLIESRLDWLLSPRQGDNDNEGWLDYYCDFELYAGSGPAKGVVCNDKRISEALPADEVDEPKDCSLDLNVPASLIQTVSELSSRHHLKPRLVTTIVRSRLVRHDFTRPFELDEDPKKQDSLTTWIEYLGYEYWWLDKYMRDIQRLEPEHDKLWQQLIDEKMTQPHETRESVRTMASAMQDQNEYDRAREAVQKAESEGRRIYKLTQEDPERLRIPTAKRKSMMRIATEKLLAAKRRFEQIQVRERRRTVFIRGTFDYVDTKGYAARHRPRPTWTRRKESDEEEAHRRSRASRETKPEEAFTAISRTLGITQPVNGARYQAVPGLKGAAKKAMQTRVLSVGSPLGFPDHADIETPSLSEYIHHGNGLVRAVLLVNAKYVWPKDQPTTPTLPQITLNALRHDVTQHGSLGPVDHFMRDVQIHPVISTATATDAHVNLTLRDLHDSLSADVPVTLQCSKFRRIFRKHYASMRYTGPNPKKRSRVTDDHRAWEEDKRERERANKRMMGLGDGSVGLEDE
ncbi:Uu.00g012920.m01.CDS01 [Anthostomella pinea]|uniref:Uu.00g012920.m01.CDS01 n=1 Tax=Anthostomella pinea TaxID=933095 RepID=A0AAI8YQ68_9PEZI|nr:Uu.00g012920.m01.CDS01 [Anthostomella pinea]